MSVNCRPQGDFFDSHCTCGQRVQVAVECWMQVVALAPAQEVYITVQWPSFTSHCSDLCHAAHCAGVHCHSNVSYWYCSNSTQMSVQYVQLNNRATHSYHNVQVPLSALHCLPQLRHWFNTGPTSANYRLSVQQHLVATGGTDQVNIRRRHYGVS